MPNFNLDPEGRSERERPIKPDADLGALGDREVGNAQGGASGGTEERRVRREPVAVLVVEPTAEEWAEHKAACARIAKAAGGTALFTSFDP